MNIEIATTTILHNLSEEVKPLVREASVDEINKAMEHASQQQLKGILGVTKEPLVSIDFNHNPMSSTFDLTQTQIVDGRLVRVLAWYDNEWGFSNRMADTAVAMGKLG